MSKSVCEGNASFHIRYFGLHRKEFLLTIVSEMARMRLQTIIFVLMLIVASMPLKAEASDIWKQVAAENKVDVYDLYAIALIESRRVWTDGQVRPWLYTLMIQGKEKESVFLPDEKVAEELLGKLLDNGVNNIDVCCMQINLKTHSWRVENPSDLFNLPTCIETGADILREALSSTPDRELGLGRYHHWRHESITRSYGKKVVALSQSLKQEGIFD